MKCNIRKNEPNAKQREELRQECAKEFEKLLDGFEHDTVVQIAYLLHTEYGFGEKRIREFIGKMREVIGGIHARYELDENDTTFICKHKLKDAGIDIDEMMGKE